jgi:hypothetical protein
MKTPEQELKRLLLLEGQMRRQAERAARPYHNAAHRLHLKWVALWQKTYYGQGTVKAALRSLKMKTSIIVILFTFLAGTAHAGLLDILRHGVPGNPDMYTSIELLGTKQHDSGTSTVQYYGNQNYGANSNGMRGQLSIPLDENSTFLFGGGWQTGSYGYSQSSYLLGQTGIVNSYNLEAGFRFYIHE